MKVKLIRKFANAIDGVDLSRVRVGDMMELTPSQAALLIREGWAELLDERPTNAKSEHNTK